MTLLYPREYLYNLNSISNEGFPWEMHQKAEPINVANFKRKQFRIAKYPSVVNINILAGFCNCITCLWLTHSFKVACPHWLRTPNEAFFFIEIPDKVWGIGVFSGNLPAPILVLWVPCPCFPLINHYFYKKTKPHKYLGFGFEFGPQRILGI